MYIKSIKSTYFVYFSFGKRKNIYKFTISEIFINSQTENCLMCDCESDGYGIKSDKSCFIQIWINENNEELVSDGEIIHCVTCNKIQ